MRDSKNDTVTIRGLVIWGLAALFFLYEFFLRAFLATIADNVTADLKLDAEKLSLIGSAYYFTYAAMQGPVGVLADIFGIKLLLSLATVVCSLGVFWFSAADSFSSALASRLVMGWGSSFAFVSLLVLSLNWFPRKNFGFLSGFAQFLGTMGPIIAGAPFAILLYRMHENWRLILLGIGTFGIILAIFIAIFVKTKPKISKEKKFIVINLRQPLSEKIKLLLKNRQAWGLVVYAGFSYAPIALLGAIWGTIYLQKRGFTKEIAALINSAIWIGVAIGAPLLGALSDKLRKRKPFLILCATLGLLSSLLIFFGPIKSVFLLTLLFFLFGVAGAGQSLCFATITEHVHSNLHASGLGLNNTAVTLFAGIFPILTGFLIQLTLKNKVGEGLEAYGLYNFNVGFSLIPLLYVLAFVISIFIIKETFCRQQHEPYRVIVK